MKDRSLNTCGEQIVPASVYSRIRHFGSTARNAELAVVKKQNYHFLSRPAPFFTFPPLTFVCKLLFQVAFAITVHLGATPIFA